jgi:hypothetical protein
MPPHKTPAEQRVEDPLVSAGERYLTRTWAAHLSPDHKRAALHKLRALPSGVKANILTAVGATHLLCESLQQRQAEATEVKLLNDLMQLRNGITVLPRMVTHMLAQKNAAISRDVRTLMFQASTQEDFCSRLRSLVLGMGELSGTESRVLGEQLRLYKKFVPGILAAYAETSRHVEWRSSGEGANFHSFLGSCILSHEKLLDIHQNMVPTDLNHLRIASDSGPLLLDSPESWPVSLARDESPSGDDQLMTVREVLRDLEHRASPPNQPPAHPPERPPSRPSIPPLVTSTVTRRFDEASPRSAPNSGPSSPRLPLPPIPGWSSRDLIMRQPTSPPSSVPPRRNAISKLAEDVNNLAATMPAHVSPRNASRPTRSRTLEVLPTFAASSPPTQVIHAEPQPTEMKVRTRYLVVDRVRTIRRHDKWERFLEAELSSPNFVVVARPTVRRESEGDPRHKRLLPRGYTKSKSADSMPADVQTPPLSPYNTTSSRPRGNGGHFSRFSRSFSEGVRHVIGRGRGQTHT